MSQNQNQNLNSFYQQKNLSNEDKKRFAAARKDIAARAREGALSFSRGVPVVPPGVVLDQSKYTLQFVMKAFSQQKFNYLINASRNALNTKVNIWASIAVNMRKTPEDFFFLYEQNKMSILSDDQCLTIAIGEKSGKFFEILENISENVKEAIQKSFDKKIAKIQQSQRTIQMGLPLFKVKGDNYTEKFTLYLKPLIDGAVSRRILRQLGAKLSDKVVVEDWMKNIANKDNYHYKLAHASEAIMKATAIEKAKMVNCPVLIQYLHFDENATEKFSFKLISANPQEKSTSEPIRPSIKERELEQVLNKEDEDQDNKEENPKKVLAVSVANDGKVDIRSMEQNHFIATQLIKKYSKELEVSEDEININSDDIKEAFDMESDIQEIIKMVDYPKISDEKFKELKKNALKEKLLLKRKLEKKEEVMNEGDDTTPAEDNESGPSNVEQD